MRTLNWIQVLALLIGVGVIGVVLREAALYFFKPEGEDDDSVHSRLP